ncbi:MAG: YraN family protein [Lachnospiraceae bacterium]
MYNKRNVGSEQEKQAVRFLTEQGYRIIECNYQCRQAEIDIIAWDREYLCFIEVKYRAGKRYGMGAEAVDVRKQRRICYASLVYLTQHGMSDVPVRYDVVSVDGERITLMKNAFEWR